MNSRGRAGGFTLAEVMVATTILAVAIVAVLAGFSQSSRVNSRVNRLERAAMIAQRELMLAVAKPDQVGGGLTGSEDLYSWTVQASDKAHGLILIRVEITWQQEGHPESLAFSRLVLVQTGGRA